MVAMVSGYESMKQKLYLSMRLVRRAQNEEGLWLHQNGKDFTNSLRYRWLGTVEQFENINRLHGGRLIPVRDDRADVSWNLGVRGR